MNSTSARSDRSDATDAGGWIPTPGIAIVLSALAAFAGLLVGWVFYLIGDGNPTVGNIALSWFFVVFVFGFGFIAKTFAAGPCPSRSPGIIVIAEAVVLAALLAIVITRGGGWFVPTLAGASAAAAIIVMFEPTIRLGLSHRGHEFARVHDTDTDTARDAAPNAGAAANADATSAAAADAEPNTDTAPRAASDVDTENAAKAGAERTGGRATVRVRCTIRPSFLAWPFHAVFTRPYITTEAGRRELNWGRSETEVGAGRTVSVGFSYRGFGRQRLAESTADFGPAPEVDLRAQLGIANSSRFAIHIGPVGGRVRT